MEDGEGERERANQDTVGFLGELQHADVVLRDKVVIVHDFHPLSIPNTKNQRKITEKTVQTSLHFLFPLKKFRRNLSLSLSSS